LNIPVIADGSFAIGRGLAEASELGDEDIARTLSPLDFEDIESPLKWAAMKPDKILISLSASRSSGSYIQ
jgi:hypothetical protein